MNQNIVLADSKGKNSWVNYFIDVGVSSYHGLFEITLIYVDSVYNVYTVRLVEIRKLLSEEFRIHLYLRVRSYQKGKSRSRDFHRKQLEYFMIRGFP